MSVPYFRVPLNLPHAATVAGRIRHHLATEDAPTLERVSRLISVLAPFAQSGDNPPDDESTRVIAEVATLLRAIVADIERLRCGHDRLGQAIRNLFECLELGEEGATISLRAGESPKSALRPI